MQFIRACLYGKSRHNFYARQNRAYLLPNSIPERVRQRVWALYLQSTNPLSLAQIARKTGISKTSVYNIVTAVETEDPNYPLMRALIIDLHKDGFDILKYSRCLRIANIFSEYSIDLEEGEAIIQKFMPQLYKTDWPPYHAIDTLIKFKESALKFGQTPREHAEYMHKLFAQERDYRHRIAEEKRQLKSIIDQNEVVKENLEVFMRGGGYVDMLRDDAIEALDYKRKYQILKKEKDSGESIDPQKIKDLNKLLLRPLTAQEVINRIEDIRMDPALYYYLFEIGPPAPPQEKKSSY